MSGQNIAICQSNIDQAKASLREAVRVFGFSRANVLCEALLELMNQDDHDGALLMAAMMSKDAARLVSFAAVAALRDATLDAARIKEEEGPPP